MKLIRAVSGMIFMGAISTPADYTNTSSVLDGSGTRSTNSTYTHLSAAGQPGGIAASSGGGYRNQAGFLNTFFLQPGLDTDGDGLADEADGDNDNDQLADDTEIGGGGFSPATPTDPNAADSDDDGAPDGAESVAGTDPTDAGALLEIVRIAKGSTADVSWRARSNKTYRILYATTPAQPVTNELATVIASGAAVPPWYALTNTVTDAGSATSRVYAVEVQP